MCKVAKFGELWGEDVEESGLTGHYNNKSAWHICQISVQFRVLGFGLVIDGKIGIGVFPNAKEFFVRFAGGSVVAHQSLCATELRRRDRVSAT